MSLQIGQVRGGIELLKLIQRMMRKHKLAVYSYGLRLCFCSSL